MRDERKGDNSIIGSEGRMRTVRGRCEAVRAASRGDTRG